MWLEECGRDECETIAGVSARIDGAKIGAGVATSFIAIPTCARAQSEHERSVPATSFG